MNSRWLSLLGLKYNPFAPELPHEALWISPRVGDFCWRIEHSHVPEGGFALIAGEPGTGKSVALRILAQCLSRVRDLQVAALAHPQSSVADFYRELGDLFGVALRPHNRWVSFKTLRERWVTHIESTLVRPVLLVDEAQEMSPAVLSELRILASAHFDSRILLSVVLAGDGRLTEALRRDELLPLGSRIRTRLALEYASREELQACLEHRLAAAGNPQLMSAELVHTLCDHAAGNYRVLSNLAGELLSAALQRERSELDEKLYFEVFQTPRESPARRRARG
jgi:type II secretory pathway predicted ATPase ExeA